MELNWIRRDFSAQSPIRETLLEQLLSYPSGICAIPDQYDEWVVAAGALEREPATKEDNRWKKER